MNYGLLVTSPIGPYKNIGDYMQSLAALQFTPSPYCYVEKEKISEFNSKEKTKVIMNAWYIWHPENWPPKENCIDPLLTSMHITPLRAEEMLHNGGKEYLINHGPVGCRDTKTVEILRDNGVPAFFSGCLTLTLGRNYKYNGVKKGVIFVDPYIAPLRYSDENGTIYYPGNIFRAIFYFILNPIKISKLAQKSYFKGRLFFQAFYNASMFYHAYSKMFDDETLLNAEYITHMLPVAKDLSQDDLLAIAEKLLKKYAKSNYVVTSRIHCALPCIGVETPVIFVLSEMMNSERNLFGSPSRFGGLIDFFRVANYSKGRVETDDNELSQFGKLNITSKFSNRENWVDFKNKMVDQCLSFMKKE